MKPLLLIFLTIACALSQSAEKAWYELVDQKSRKSPEFSYQTNNPELPNVLIYGDSISIQYHKELREKLTGKANLYRLPWNGGDSSTLILKMTKLHETMGNPDLDAPWNFKWDVVQFNVGLHDLKYMDGKKLDKKAGKQVSSLRDYEKNLQSIIPYLRELAPGAKLIFATTTPVPEGGNGRVAGDAIRYNQVAAKVLKENPDIIVNDLYSFTKPNQPKWWTKPGNVHFNAKGQKAQAEHTSEVILKALEK